MEDELAACRSPTISLHCGKNQFLEVTAINKPTHCQYTCSYGHDCLANALEDIQKDCNNRQSCELLETVGVWDHFPSLSEEIQEGVLELEMNLDVTFDCLNSFVEYPETGKSNEVQKNKITCKKI